MTCLGNRIRLTPAANVVCSPIAAGPPPGATQPTDAADRPRIRSPVAVTAATIRPSAYPPIRLRIIFPSDSDGNAPVLDPDGGLLRGTLDLLILKSLSWGPRHGYAVAEWIHAATDNTLLVEEGPLYTALHRLEKKGWLEAEWGLSEKNRKAKYYVLSRSGGSSSGPRSRAGNGTRAR